MYAGRVVCCRLVSHGEYADGTNGRMEGRQTVTLSFFDKCGQRKKHLGSGTVRHSHMAYA